MIMDKENLFSEAQAVTASAGSTNVIDLGANDALIQELIDGYAELFAQVVTGDFTTGTSIKIGVQIDDDVAFGSATTLLETAVIALADLVEGYKFKLPKIPSHIAERYMRFYYTVVGTMAVGGITAGIALDKQTNGVG